MATDQLLAYFQNKKLLPLDMMESYFFDYLKAVAENVFKAQYRKAGVFDSVATVTGTAIGEVSLAGAFEATDGDGHKFDFGASDSRLQDVPFQNTAAVNYHMGLQQVQLVEELDVNPRTGQPEYRARKENIGTSGTPNAVVDNGSNITLTVDSVTESGVSHAGRTVRVYLVTPKAASWASAYEDRPVTWTGSANKITTTGLLGQEAGSVSTTPADYVVVELGPVIVREATRDLKTASGVCFLAEFLGNAGSAPTPIMTDQRILSGSLSDLADITRYCPHTELKVSVRADASDSGEDQVRVESSGGSRMWGVDEAGKHWIPAASAAVPLGDATSPFSDYVPFLNGGSFLGVVNQVSRVSAKAMGPMVLFGMEFSSGTGGVFYMTAGDVWCPGALGGDGGAQSWTSPSVACANGTGYVYVHPTNGLQHTLTKATAYAGGNLPLYEVTFSAGTITAYTDLAFRASDVQRHGVITVGGNAVSGRQANFKSIKTALDYMDAQSGEDTDYWAGVELWIVDDIDIGNDRNHVHASLNGITIRGVGGQRQISYGDTNPYNACFHVEANKVRFVNLYFYSTETGAGTSSAGVQQYAAGVGDEATFLDCRFGSQNNTLAFGVFGLSGWDGLQFHNCQFDLANTSPTSVAVAKSGGQYWRFQNCVINGVNTKTQLSDVTGALLDSVWIGCRFVDVYRAYILATTALYKTRARFYGCIGSLGQIANGEFHGCEFSGTRLVTGANDEIVFFGGALYDVVDPIQKDNNLSVIRLHGVRPIEVGTGSTYVVGGSSPWNIHIDQCHIRPVTTPNPIGGGVPFSLGLYSTFTNNTVAPLRASTYQNYPFLQVVSGHNEVRITGNRMDPQWYNCGIKINSSCYHVVVANNQIDGNSTSGAVGGYAGVELHGQYCNVVGNDIWNNGDTSNGGIGVYVNNDFNVIKGNNFYWTRGAAVHLTSAAAYNVVSDNVINTCGYAGITNAKIGTTSLDGITLAGSDYNVVSQNTINGASAASGRGIRVQTGSLRNSINGNTIGSVTGGRGIELEATSQACVCQLNATVNTVLDNGTGNLVGANTGNNNV